MAATHYRWGSMHVVVWTGQPQDPVQVGMGDTLRGAVGSLEATPIQSVGRDCGESAALRWAMTREGGDAPGLTEVGPIDLGDYEG